MVNILLGQTLTTHYRTVPNSYNFWFYEPEAIPHPSSIQARRPMLNIIDSTETTKPLVIFLHGASLCGRDLQKVRHYGTIDALERGLKLDAFVIAPQNPGGAWSPSKVGQLIDWCEENYPIDTTRIYVLGMSLGGFGTIDVAAEFPDRIAAAIALCGGNTTKKISNLNQLPLVIAHGTADRAVPCRNSENIVNTMKQTRGEQPDRLIWMKMKGRTHGDLARYFYLQDVYRWLFAHSTADSLRLVSRDFDFSFDRLKNVYRDIKPGITPIKFRNQKELARKDDIDRQQTVTDVAEQDTGTDSDAPVYYRIRQGDTLSAIARKYKTNVKKICKLNNMSETTTLRIGKSIRVK